MSTSQDNFDPNGFATNQNIYGLPYTFETAKMVVLPLPWEVTVSYNTGTQDGPEVVLEESKQVDLYDPYIKDAWKIGLCNLPINEAWYKASSTMRQKGNAVIEALMQNGLLNDEENKILNEVNLASKKFNEEVYIETLKVLEQNKILVGLGGDHSTPYGIIKAYAQKYQSFAILQLDAHCDLRNAYEGFEYSHASIMYNVLRDIPQVSKLVQAGIRDYCEEEKDYILNSNNRVVTFFDRDLKKKKMLGESTSKILDEIVNELPQNIYLSFDIDALDPKLCYDTGTPVPGGFEFDEVLFLIEKIVETEKTIIGFDLNEVSDKGSRYNANVGARLLYKICNMIAKSQNILK
jgi:agmatinase